MSGPVTDESSEQCSVRVVQGVEEGVEEGVVKRSVRELIYAVVNIREGCDDLRRESAGGKLRCVFQKLQTRSSTSPHSSHTRQVKLGVTRNAGEKSGPRRAGIGGDTTNSTEMSTDSLAFYCSGHGFGHSTRVSAITAALLPHYTVHIVTSAPPHPFQAVLEPTASSPTPSTSQPRRYATYRYAEIDAQVVQPLAYEVDRKATYIRLKSFLEEREEKLAVEVAWLQENGFTCVLSDATFLGW